MNKSVSLQLYEMAKTMMPAGVNSPVRAFLSVNDTPFYVEKGKGAYLYDVDGNTFVDYVASWGAIILGHAQEGLVEEIKKALEYGIGYGTCHPDEIELAGLILDAFPSMEMLRLTTSGTEATMSAIRLARGVTGKDNIIKFRGGYHGHADCLLVKAGSGPATYGLPDSLGVPADIARHTFVAEFNDIDSVKEILDENDGIACIIVEPVMANMGVIPPQNGFLTDLKDICTKEGILLIFDEVITGFRMAYGGAQSVFGIEPDITCLGKIIGGGFPVGAYGGRREIMKHLAPRGGVYQAGTLAGNRIGVRAGIYVLNYLKRNRHIYDNIKVMIEGLREKVLEMAEKWGVPYRINHVTGMFTGLFSDHDVVDYRSAIESDRRLYEIFFKSMLEEGIFFAPSQFEAAFLTASHGIKELEKAIEAYDKCFSQIKRLS